MSYWAAGAAIVSALVGGYSIVQQGNTARKVGAYNAKMNELSAQDAEKRGDQQANDLARRMAALKGAQRSRMAAAGLDLEDGTAADIQDQTDFFADRDVATLRFNGRKDAWSARQAGSIARWTGDSNASQAGLSAFGTVLSAASRVSDKWYTSTTPPPKTTTPPPKTTTGP